MLVPIASYFFFNEPLGWQNAVASFLIISGICVVSFGRGLN
jgi:drug/metabolite transporter (DMT)-like permease